MSRMVAMREVETGNAHPSCDEVFELPNFPTLNERKTNKHNHVSIQEIQKQLPLANNIYSLKVQACRLFWFGVSTHRSRQ